MNKDELKEFSKAIMEEMNVKGGKLLKLIQLIAPKYNYDRKMIMVQVRRALIGSH